MGKQKIKQNYKRVKSKGHNIRRILYSIILNKFFL
jgi:hypothetical protein